MTVIDRKPAPGGHDLVVWNGRDASGVPVTDVRWYYIGVPEPLRVNSVIVQGVTPTVTGNLSSPRVEVKSDPYLIYGSYNQVTRIAYCLDQDAVVTMKLLRPGFVDPDDPEGVVHTFVADEIRTATDCAGGGAPHEESFAGKSIPGEEGAYTFTIEARSVVAPGYETLYRGVVQARQ